MRNGKTLTLILSLVYLHETGMYTKQMLTLKGDFHTDLEVPLCAYQESDGTLRITADIPAPPELDDVPRTVFLSGRGEISGMTATANVTNAARPPTLPENPTPKQRWEYLLAVVKQK